MTKGSGVGNTCFDQLCIVVNCMLVFLILVGGDAINNYGHKVLLSIFFTKGVVILVMWGWRL